MDLENEVFHWIERYLTGEMSAEEVAHFEMLLKNDAALRSKVERQRSFSEALTSYGKREKLKSDLNRFHASQDLSDLVKLYTPTPAPLYGLWARHKVGLAVAASALILLISGSMYYQNQRKLDGQMTQVSALRRDVESVRKSQHAIISHLAPAKGHPSRSGNYGGTGFLIDPKGYIVTSLHIVDGSDSVFVQNDKGQSYKTSLVYRNKEYDLAVLEIQDSGYKAPAMIPYTFRKVSPELGQQIYTLGYPRDEIVYNEGYMSSATGFQGDTVSYQLSIPVNPGNSGGPVLDNQGNVLGIISGKQTQVDGVAFAIRSSCLVKALSEAAKDTTSKLQRRINLPMKAPKQFSLASSRRTQQIKKLGDFIYLVKAFN